MQIPGAQFIEMAVATISADPAASARNEVLAAKELHVSNPAFVRGLTAEQFATYAHAYYFGLIVADVMSKI